MNTPRKILIIGGLHGDETLGIDLVNRIRNEPITGIDTIFGNPMATAVQARYIDRDLNRVFPGRLDGCLEEVRANQIMQMVSGYDLIIDFHNTRSDDNNCSFVGATFIEETLQLSLFMGLNRIVIANYNCINKYLPNCLSIEISFSSSALNNTDYWYKKILALSTADIKNQSLADLQLFKFIDRVNGDVYQQFNFNFQNFESIARQDRLDLGRSAELDMYAIFVNPNLFAGNYCAVVEKTSLPLID